MAEIDIKLSNKEENDLTGSDPGISFDSIQKYDSDLKLFKKITVDKNINRIYNEAFSAMLSAGIPSFVLLVLSFFVGVADVPFMGNVFQSISNYISPGQQPLNSEISAVTLWWFPFIIYLIFIFFAILANKGLKSEFREMEASEASITRIIDRFSGIVDGLGTALPLLGAAILLISIEKGPVVFLGFAVPFEIKSILILAIAKLFDSIFDALALKYQEIQEDIKNVEKAYHYFMQEKLFSQRIAQRSMEPRSIKIESTVSEAHLNKISETMQSNKEMGISIKELITEINNLKLPDEKVLRELESTAKFLGVTLESLKDENVLESLKNLAYLSGKRESQE